MIVYDADRCIAWTVRGIIFRPRVVVERPSSWEVRAIIVVIIVPIVEYVQVGGIAVWQYRMTSELHEQVQMAEVLPRKESAAQVIVLPWPFAPLDLSLGEPLQQGTPVSRTHADSAQ